MSILDQPVVLRASQVRKAVGASFSLNDVSVAVRRGEGVAVVGNNGAGKSTLLRVLVGLSRVDAGRVEINDRTVGRWRGTGDQVGFVQQSKALPDALTVRDYLRHQLRLRRAKPGAYGRLLMLAGLQDAEAHPVAQLSGGNQRKVQIIAACAHEPGLLALDEPSTGLDGEAKDSLLGLLTGLKRAGMALLFATHDPEEVRRLADHVLALRGGRQIGVVPASAIDRAYRSAPCLQVVPEGDVPTAERIQALAQANAPGLEHVIAAELSGLTARLSVRGHGVDHLAMTVAAFSKFGIRLRSINYYEPMMADIVALQSRRKLDRTPNHVEETVQ